ncbi:MAG: sigma-54 dependent transcriptional regulator [Myxococcota bacterium]
MSRCRENTDRWNVVCPSGNGRALPAMKPTMLIVDDDVQVQALLGRILEQEGYDVVQAVDGESGLSSLARHPVDIVLLDLHLPDQDGLSVLGRMRSEEHDQPVLMMSGEGTVESAVQATRLGAVDFLQKPLLRERVVVTVANVLRFEQLRRENEVLSSGLRQGLVGSGRAMRALNHTIDKAAPTEGRVLITGENGTGKELVARALHERSQRAGHAFVKINCAAVPRDLIESELFGHEQGAFTGATRTRRGKFELADEGTLFLDEIGEMPPQMQAKVLRVLQEGEFERVGGDRTISVDVRVIAATNRQLEQMIQDGTFRQDLYYRLNVIHIRTPPLRERFEDIPELIHHFIARAVERNSASRVEFHADAVEHLQRHEFPGNVRELQNLVERLVIMRERDVVDVGDIIRHVGMDEPAASIAKVFEPGHSFRTLVDRVSRRIIEEALDHHDFNMTETARALEMERSHLYKKCRALGVDHKR